MRGEVDRIIKSVIDIAFVCNMVHKLRQNMKNLPTLWSEELGNGIKFVHGEGEQKECIHGSLNMAC